ncbi:hypothetical protein PV08_05541 [Exophiala spinifera]|uniref:ferric-chelate reductase (NADPH) n=1 Tax=Exophiala spinifera TaxID=91928 RepID=A0A0D2BAB3_9EURO|nr:uncharacterized protein PV08_05541 [Exophiala spinifera]KIW15495.1 hypothetical protein PV08_05541 [Exophiala spinifera]
MASTTASAAYVSAGNGTQGSSQYQNAGAQEHLAHLNKILAWNYLWALLGVAGVAFVYATFRRIDTHVRHLASMNRPAALRYFSKPSSTLSLIKSHLLYAPLLHHRRAGELKVSKRISFGTVPTRLQAVFIFLLLATNVFACVWNIPWPAPELQVLPVLRDRFGSLSVVNLIPIVVLSTVKNPLIWLLDISYDTFNLLHRWLGRISILQGIAHVICYLIAKVKTAGWAGVGKSVQAKFIYSGLIAAIAFTVILLQSPKVLRGLSYEFFLHFHIVLVILMCVFLWIHLDVKTLPQRHQLLGFIILWAVFRAWRFATLLYRSFGSSVCKAKVEAMPGGAVKLHITSPRPWQYRPGQSLFLTIPSVGLWTAHPFSVAWSGSEETISRSDSTRTFNEKAPIVQRKEVEVDARGDRTMSLVIKKHRGLTRKLWDRAGKAEGHLTVNAYIEGPYGHEQSLSSYGTVMLFAGGVGITHQLPYVRELVEGYSHGTVAAQRVTLVWVIRTADCLDWIRPWMHEVLNMEGRREVLKILVYVTQEGLTQSVRSPSETVRMSRGRPDVLSLMAQEVEQKMGCVGVSVCAGGGLADEVRRSSRVLLGQGANLDFMEETFGW